MHHNHHRPSAADDHGQTTTCVCVPRAVLYRCQTMDDCAVALCFAASSCIMNALTFSSVECTVSFRFSNTNRPMLFHRLCAFQTFSFAPRTRLVVRVLGCCAEAFAVPLVSPEVSSNSTKSLSSTSERCAFMKTCLIISVAVL